jgi:hypothetical protein
MIIRAKYARTDTPPATIFHAFLSSILRSKQSGQASTDENEVPGPTEYERLENVQESKFGKDHRRHNQGDREERAAIGIQTRVAGIQVAESGSWMPITAALAESSVLH